MQTLTLPNECFPFVRNGAKTGHIFTSMLWVERGEVLFVPETEGIRPCSASITRVWHSRLDVLPDAFILAAGYRHFWDLFDQLRCVRPVVEFETTVTAIQFVADPSERP